MELNIEKLPTLVSAALTRRAAEEGQSVSEVAVETLAKGLGVGGPGTRKRDLSRFSGTWIEDRAIDTALQAFEEIDQE